MSPEPLPRAFLSAPLHAGIGKRRLALLAGVATVAALLAGCGTTPGRRPRLATAHGGAERALFLSRG